MSDSPRSEPVRSCIGCRRRRLRSALVRITKAGDHVVVDGVSDGRGAWLCRSDRDRPIVVIACLEAALSKRAFARAWRREVSNADEQAIRTLVAGAAGGDEHPDVQ